VYDVNTARNIHCNSDPILYFLLKHSDEAHSIGAELTRVSEDISDENISDPELKEGAKRK
jgi:hypothetical protein